MTMLAPPPQAMPSMLPPATGPTTLPSMSGPSGQQFTQPPLLKEEEFSRLKEQVENAHKSLEQHRNARKKAKKQYIGDAFGNDGTGATETVVNMLDQMVEVYMQQLVSGDPKVLVMTEKLAMRATARYFQTAFNHIIRQIKLADSMKMAVLESMFSPICAVKVGVELPSQTDRAYPFDASAVPFVEAIFFNDWVHDTQAERWDLCRFYGDRYKEHVDTIKADPRNDPEILKDLEAGFENYQYDSTTATDERPQRNAPYDTEQRDFIPLWDIYLPRKRVLVTWMANGNNEKPLRIVKWDGPPEGPYYVAKYKLVPNEIMGKPPVYDILALADIHNRQWIKMARQASRKKTVGFATMAAAKDAQRVIHANDGDVIGVTNPQAVTEMKFGGADQESLTFAQVAKQEASYNAGNLDTMGGLSSQASTLGQEKLLASSSSDRIRSRQQAVIQLTKDVLWAVGWYIWNDPLVRVNVTDKIPDTNVEMEVQWPRQTNEYGMEVDLRQGEYNDLNLDIEAYSMVDKSPAEIGMSLMQIVSTTILPALGMMQQQQLGFDWREYLNALSELLGIEQLKWLIIDGQPQPDPDQQVANLGGVKPPQSTRIYDRRSTKGQSGPGDAAGELISHMPSPTTGNQ